MLVTSRGFWLPVSFVIGLTANRWLTSRLSPVYVLTSVMRCVYSLRPPPPPPLPSPSRDTHERGRKTTSATREVQHHGRGGLVTQRATQQAQGRPDCLVEGQHQTLPAAGGLSMLIPLDSSTSTPSEQVFSVAEFVVDNCRCDLSPKMINALVFLHSNW